jgi:hypothetical protein
MFFRKVLVEDSNGIPMDNAISILPFFHSLGSRLRLLVRFLHEFGLSRHALEIVGLAGVLCDVMRSFHEGYGCGISRSAGLHSMVSGSNQVTCPVAPSTSRWKAVDHWSTWSDHWSNAVSTFRDSTTSAASPA